VRDVKVVALSIGVGLALCVLGTAAAVAASPKLSERDFNRLGSADRAALTNLGLVMQRGCDADDVPCMNKATVKEISTARRAADLSKSLLRGLAKGKCRRAVAANFTQWNRRVGLVAKARNAWPGHHYREANQAYYYGKWKLDLANLVGVAC
jgi:hypothetical protein